MTHVMEERLARRLEHAAASPGGEELLPVDGHVHWHSCFDDRRFLDAAAANFRAATRTPRGVLMLAERAGENVFEQLRVRHIIGERWHPSPTHEPTSLLLRSDTDEELIIIAGRQIVTRERLEVLGLACDLRLKDGMSITEAITRLHEAGALVVLPWGIGKWWGQRGRIIERILAESSSPAPVFLGDNGNRPVWTPQPRLFGEARRRGVAILPGSDPLPLAQHQCRAGSCGFLMPLDMQQPARSLRAHLHSRADVPRRFGSRVGIVECVRSQLALRLGT